MSKKRSAKPVERSIYTLDLNKVDSEGISHGEELLSSYPVHPTAEKDLQKYLGYAKRQNFFSKAISKIAHVIWWGIRLFLPSFLFGHPSLFDNIKTLWKNPQFRPLRMLGLAWLVFVVIIGGTGIYSYLEGGRTHASGSGPQIQTGYYFGTGATLSITGLGFAPQVVMVKSDTAAGSTVWKSSSMPAGEYAYLGTATADNTENQISLDSDGFTVQIAADVNAVNIRYTYIAFAGSDCTSSGYICVGSYTGNGTAGQNISTGFQPDLVWDKRATALSGNFRTSSMATNNTSSFNAVADDIAGLFTTLNSTSFTVGGTNNTNGGTYYFLAFKSAPNFLTVGSYTGDGTNARTISGVGFKPNFVLTKANTAIVPAYNITQSWGDYSSQTTALANVAGAIQKLQNDGFVIGTLANSNTLGTAYQYFAFGGAVAPVPSGSFTMRRGSYTGNGAARSISGIGFSPDLVMIKSDGSADYSVWSTSLDNNLTHYFAVGAAGIVGAITSTNSDGFSLGTNSAVNTNGVVYEYIVFGNATSPQKTTGASDFFIGTYTGNGIDGRVIDNLGVAPDMVVTKSNSTGVGVWRSSTMATNTAAMFAAAADDATGIHFKTLNSDGFTIGNNAIVNGAGVVYHFFGFKKGAGTFNVGSYTGSGVGKNITGLGFQPDLVWDKAATAVRGAHRSSSATITTTNSQTFLNAANFVNAITGFVSDGFSVGTAAEANTNAVSYRWVAWSAPTPTSGPDTPSNSSPSNGAASIDLNPTISGSSYLDSIGGNSQTDAQWQVDDHSDFSAPVWTRTAGTAETSTVVNASNGTFSNDLAGAMGLTHSTTYYWRVRYSNGIWSSWSSGTNFNTNIIQTPSNQLPTDGATAQTLTPTLTASAFSDQQLSHTGLSAEWQLSKTSSFTSTSYDSGEVGYSNSFAVPSAILSNQTTYYWRVRYKDSSSQWSSYSTPTRFLVSQSVLSVKPLFSNTVVDQGDQINIDAQVSLTEGSVIGDAVTTINVYNPSGIKIVNGAAMNYIASSSGIYRYVYTVPSSNGSYLYEVIATKSGNTGYGAGNFQVKTLSADINSINNNASSTNSTINSINTTVNTINSTASSTNGTVNSINSTVNTINTSVNEIRANMASLISEIGTGNIAAIRTNTNTINWADITGIITTSNAVKAKTDTISWANITAIKTQTDTINWSDVSGIKLKTDTIDWGDITNIKSNVATLINEIGTGNIAAIKTQTDSIDWNDITGLVTTAGNIKTKTDTIDWNDISAIKTSTNTIHWSDVTGIKVKTDTINWSDVTDTKDAVQSVQGSLDMLVGALIVTQSSVNDSTPSNSLFFTNLINTTDNFYKNAVLTFTTGDLKGQSRRIAGYTGSSKTIRLDPALSAAPANGDQFTIVAQNVHVEEIANDISSTTADTNAKVTDIQTKVNTILPLLQGVDNKLDTLQGSINTLRASQQSSYTLNFTSSPMIETGKTYRAKLEIADFQSDHADASSMPTLTIYDSNRTVIVSSGQMNKTSTGVYEYTYVLPGSAASGLWESVVTVPLGSASQTRTNYWTVSGAPAKVQINSMESVTVPDISANVTITNEGTAAYKYQYQWCVVSNQSDSCNSPNVIDSASAAKLIQPNEDFSPTLSLTVPSPGAYWFKLLVTFGGQVSAATRGFTAVGSSDGDDTDTDDSSGSSSHSGDGSSDKPATSDEIMDQLQANSSKLSKMLSILGNVDPKAQGFMSLLSIDEQNTTTLKDIQNKMADLKTVSATLHQIADQKSVDPIVQTYMKFNSVELTFLITNPNVKATTVTFKAFLPEEVKPSDIMNSNGLKIDYDANAKAYYASGEIDLDPGQSATRKVEIKDIWMFSPSELQDILKEAHSVVDSLAETQFAAQSSLLENDLKSKVSMITTSQAASYDTPENHIVVYRQNKVNFVEVNSDLTKLKDTLVQSGASQGLLGKIGGIQTFAAWGIILAIVFGFILMAAIIFAMWRNQMMLTAMAMRVQKRRLQAAQMAGNERTA